jgi:isopentenyl-diphosphate delta-isomerase
MEEIIIVDRNDNQIGTKPRDQITKDDIYRISSCWVRNSKGEVLIAQRSFNKSHDPGKFGPACAGTLATGETYESNAAKELGEELGLKDIELVKGPKVYNEKNWKLFCQWFFVTVDKPAEEFVIQKEEVEQVRWIDEQELIRKIREKPEEFVGTMGDVLRDLKLTVK